MSHYKKITKNIQELVITGGKGGNAIRWFNIANPGKEELDFLRKMKKYSFDFHELRASSVKVQAERPIIEQKGKYFFLILHFPVFKDEEIVAAEIDFFIAHGLLITLHDGRLKILDDFFNTARKDGSSLMVKKFPSSAVLLAELLEKLVTDCYGIMDKNNVKINAVEKMIFANEQKKSVARILELEHNIINIRRTMLNHKNILKRLVQMKSSIIPPAVIKSFYYNLIEQTKRIWEFSESQKETVEALRSANESLLDFRTSSIIKTLTIVSVIFAPLSFIVALLTISVQNGMPLLDTPNGFWIVTYGLGLLAALMLLFFVRKKWL
ncbi:MAG: CorA family divalent cation transporter [Patescibacteria group bacterium]|nr:CorA family divalent cation transporter [Patescibacteria group bacterium]